MAESEWTEEKFRALTTYSADIISLLDAEGRLLFNSPATLRISGFSPEELEDRDTFELIHPDDRATVGAAFAEVIATPGAVRTMEYRYRTKDDRWLWMEAVARNLLDDPTVRGVVANSRDISERKRAEEERQRLELQMLQMQKLESLGVMAGGVAHDFNNLLAIVLGETNLLQRRLRTDAFAADALGIIETAVQRAADLTRQLLAYAGRRTAPLEPTDLRALIHDLAPLLRLSSRGSAPVRLELAEVPPVVCDRGQLRQLLINLVLNASEALDNRGEVVVRLSHREVTREELERGPLTVGFEPGPAIVVEVIDTGAGMAPETVARIFDPFFSTKQTGRGLGLAAVSGIVRSHGAALGVESEPGRGSTFTLYLRVAGELSQPQPALSAGRFQGRALIIDDEPMVAQTAARTMTGLGFECDVCTSGQEAITRFRAASGAFAVVLCDLLMPELDGAETVARLRALRAEVPVIFCSGYSPALGALRGDDKTVFLAKPFDTLQLTASLGLLGLSTDVSAPAP